MRYVDRGYNNRTYVVRLDAGSKVVAGPVDGTKVAGPNGVVGSKGVESNADLSSGTELEVIGSEVTKSDACGLKDTGPNVNRTMVSVKWARGSVDTVKDIAPNVDASNVTEPEVNKLTATVPNEGGSEVAQLDTHELVVTELDTHGSKDMESGTNGSKDMESDTNGSKVMESDTDGSKVMENSDVDYTDGSNVMGLGISGSEVMSLDTNGSMVRKLDVMESDKDTPKVSGSNEAMPKIVGSAWSGSKVDEHQVIGPEIVVRLGGRFWTKRKTENEVACLAYLRDLRPRLPVPRVLFYASSRTLIGAEYIGMELLPGRPLDEAWPELNEAQRLTAVGQLAEMLAEIRSLTFDTVGNLGFRPLPGKALPDSADVFVDRCFEVDCGPFEDHGAFVKAIFQGAMDTFMTHPFFRPLWRPLAPRLHRFGRACFKARQGAMADAVAGPAEAVMTHYDLEPRNVLVDAHGGVTGLLDWEFAGAFPADIEWFSSLEFLDANTAEVRADAMYRAGEDALCGAGGGVMSSADYSVGGNLDDDSKSRVAEDCMYEGTEDDQSVAEDDVSLFDEDVVGRVAKDAMDRITKAAMNQVSEEFIGRVVRDAMNKVAEDALSSTGNDAMSGAGEGATAWIREETSRYRKHFMTILESHGVSMPPRAHKERHLMRADLWALQDNMAPWYLQQVGEEPPPEAVEQRAQSAIIIDAILRKYGF